MKHTFDSPGLPAPAGPYSHCVRKGNMLFLAGMVGALPDGEVIGPDVAEQTRQCIRNMQACLEDVGASLEDVCTVTAFLEDADHDFADYNTAYRGFFASEPPARATVQAHLLGEYVVEIQATAVVEGA
jgi:2-iminobutanoate/2-iminopropanoate deaminase